jgi:integrase
MTFTHSLLYDLELNQQVKSSVEAIKRTNSYFGLQDAFDDFILSRQGMNCSKTTIKWYEYMLGRIIRYFLSIGISSPGEISRYAISQFLTQLIENGNSSSYVYGYGRVIKTFNRFLYKEGYVSSIIEFSMPILKKRRQRVYDELEIKKILANCKDKRDTAFILFMLDTGIRNAEVRNLNWGDCDLKSGIVRIQKGKGGKFRSVVLSIPTRRALIKYRSEVDLSNDKPLFQTVGGTRFKESGLRSWMLRLSKRAGIHITPHALRRTFAKYSLKQGIDLFHLQALMGHSSLETTRDYVELLEDDLIEAHDSHSPVKYILNSETR